MLSTSDSSQNSKIRLSRFQRNSRVNTIHEKIGNHELLELVSAKKKAPTRHEDEEYYQLTKGVFDKDNFYWS